jgi:hypothetical protein
MEKMKTTFTSSNLPTILLSVDVFIDIPVSCATYGCYKGRQKESDIDIIYLNQEVNIKYTS